MIQLDSESAGSTFSKASFVADGSSEDLDITDPDFWQKWAEKAKLDLDQLASKVCVFVCVCGGGGGISTACLPVCVFLYVCVYTYVHV